MNAYEAPLETMDDLRAAMESPAVTAANRELSRRFLKNNRPKSLLVAALAVAAVFLMLGLSSHKASSVTPAALRTAETVTISWNGHAAVPLSAGQREALLALLGQTKVERAVGIIDDSLPENHCVITAGEEAFTLTSGGWLLTERNPYALVSPGPEAFWSRLEDLLAA